MDYFAKIDDVYLRERSSDVEHIVNRVMVNLTGSKHESVTDLKSPAIVVAHDLTPADTAQMVKGMVLGFLTDVGGRTSHTAIMARSIEIPAVVGLENVTRKGRDRRRGYHRRSTGTVIINPSESVTDVYRKRKEKYEAYGRTLLHYKDLPCETTDGRRTRLMGNLEITEELDALMEHGVEGIGLYRTEFLYLNRKDMPTEAEQLKAYSKVVKTMAGRPVVIRTLDVGADKVIRCTIALGRITPAMGLRAIRYSLKNPDIFKTQLRAALRASALGKGKDHVPDDLRHREELRQAKGALEDAKAELRSEGKAFDESIEVGAMIEVLQPR